MNFAPEDLRASRVVTDGCGRRAILFMGRTFDFRAPDDVNNVMVEAVVEALQFQPEDDPDEKDAG